MNEQKDKGFYWAEYFDSPTIAEKRVNGKWYVIGKKFPIPFEQLTIIKKVKD
jgi:hypothetical protein